MKKTLSGVLLFILVILISGTSVFANSSTRFKDVRPDDWHFGYVMALTELKVIRGYNDNTFRPHAEISKAEFVVMAMKSKYHYYPTAMGEHWAMNYLRGAEELGVLDADESKSMAHDEPINRAEAARILVRLQLKGEFQEAAFGQQPFSDFNSIPVQFQTHVLTAYHNGWISGYPDGDFKPIRQVTRAEASVMLTKSMGEPARARMNEMALMAARILQQETAQEETKRTEILETAMSLIGTPYRFGGTTPNGFDCSGYVKYIMDQYGITLPRTSSAMYQAADTIPPEELEPGDLVFFRGYQPGPSHVGIYAGDNSFIHAPSAGKTVSISQIDDSDYWGSRFIGAAKVI